MLMNRMRVLCLLTLLGSLVGSASSAQAAMIAGWNFNDNTSTATLFTPSFGTGTMSTNFESANVTDFTGSTVNARNGDVAGRALALQNGVSGINNGRWLQFTVNTTNYLDLQISFATQRTNTGFDSNQLQYSLNGTDFVNFGSTYAPPSSFGLQSFDLSSVAGLNNNSSAAFRIVFNGGSTTSAAGNNRIDNLVVEGTASTSVTAVPVPSGLVIGVVGVGFMGLRRRFMNTMRV